MIFVFTPFVLVQLFCRLANADQLHIAHKSANHFVVNLLYAKPQFFTMFYILRVVFLVAENMVIKRFMENVKRIINHMHGIFIEKMFEGIQSLF